MPPWLLHNSLHSFPKLLLNVRRNRIIRRFIAQRKFCDDLCERNAADFEGIRLHLRVSVNIAHFA